MINMNLFCEPPNDAVLPESAVTCIARAQVSPVSASLRAAGEGLVLLLSTTCKYPAQTETPGDSSKVSHRKKG